jgi:pSer/pThr/pTyr-binding forkhead associated (FHA) protein
LGDQPRVTRYLVYRCGSGPQQVAIWDTVEITVGRRKSQDIAVEDAEVSREHAVFRKVGDRYTVEDLGTGLGTLVNGERIKSHDLQGGDVVQIGTLAIEFGETHESIRPGGAVRYASELKAFGPQPGTRAAGGRTMLAFDAAEDLAPPTNPSPQTSGRAKAVSAEGILEDLAGADPLGSEDYDDYLGPPPQVRDLDRELNEDPDMGPTQTIVRLELKLEGPRAALQAVLSAVEDKSIEVPPIRIQIRRLRGD